MNVGNIDGRIDWEGIRDTCRTTRKYLLSHHQPSERYRCYSPHLVGRQLYVCSRCLGIYPGIGIGLWYGIGPQFWGTHLLLVAVSPIFALVDWSLTTFFDRRGYNSLRTITGGLLGFGYGLGLYLLVVEGIYAVLVIGAAYAGAAGTLLVKSMR